MSGLRVGRRGVESQARRWANLVETVAGKRKGRISLPGKGDRAGSGVHSERMKSQT